MKKKNRNSNRVYVNKSIRAPKVRCIDHNNNNVGIIDTRKAIAMAEEVGLDLVLVTPSKNGQAPICKILDYGKYKYELSKRQKEQKRKQRESSVKTKEIKLKPTTDINDLKTKAKRANQFINDGCRVKVTVRFKGREMAHKHVGEQRLDMFLDMLEFDFETSFKTINEPKMSGKDLSTLIAADKVVKQEKAEPIEKAS